MGGLYPPIFSALNESQRPLQVRKANDAKPSNRNLRA